MSRKKSSNRRSVNGMLLLDKPEGMSSNAVLQRVKQLFFAAKAGHTGSLDPLATGVLPICFGEATKFSQYFLDADKTYEVVAKLGVRTTTSDAEGEVVQERDVPDLSIVDIETACDSLRGEIDQTPSIYSALKYEGKPLYYYARQGINVPRPTRRICIYQLDILDFKKDKLTMRIHCSKGTYIRTLVDDLGEILGCGAHVEKLRRTDVGGLDISIMTNIEALTQLKEAQHYAAMDDCLLPLEKMMSSWPSIKLNEDQEQAIRYGQIVIVNSELDLKEYALFNELNKFIGVGFVAESSVLKAKRLVSQNLHS